ncbi:type II secretion system protein GspL [Zoogloea sp.]|uniref:type II secretion system protein GspL n=1 Tax=Zoogloea sp. TaxID=49181 RepID=UPI0025EE9CFB|nr:type II secretion system protein GspL [Zoogloea sp.]MCK6392086.1 type II secretion system protein GspL [Zoogloea sp.]
MTRLLLAIDEHWPTRPECAWALLGPDGQPLSEGHSAPRHWPAADECSVVLTGAQCLWLDVPLPRGARRDLPRLLSYALEDRLLKDPDTQHLTLSHRRPANDGERDLAGVLVIARERLRSLMAQFAAIGRVPRRVVAQLQTAPADEAGWHLSLSAEGAILRTSTSTALALDRDILVPLLSAQAASARAANAAPARVDVHPAPGSPAFDIPAAEAESGLTLHPAAPYLWWQGNERQAANLLHGEFASGDRGAAWMARLRAPALLGTAALGLWLATNVGEVLWQRHVLGGFESRIERVYRSAFPNSPVVAPAAQMRQQLNAERARHGQLRDDDALSLLAQAAEALGTDATDGIAALRFEEGRLDLTLSGPAAARAEALVGLLSSRGLLANLRQEGNATHLLLRQENLQ